MRQTERLRDATAMGAEIGAQSSAAHLFARAAASVAALIALFILSAAAHAQSCSPAEPRSDSGARFTPFGAREQLLARGGHKGRAWEWALGTDTRTRQKVQASLDWVSGRVYSWTLVNSGAGSEVLEIRDAVGLRLRLAYPSGMDAGNALELRVSTHPSVGAKTSIEASLTSLNGHNVSGSLSQPGTRARSEQALYYYFPNMAQGFTAEGTVSLTYPKKPRSGSRVQFIDAFNHVRIHRRTRELIVVSYAEKEQQERDDYCNSGNYLSHTGPVGELLIHSRTRVALEGVILAATNVGSGSKSTLQTIPRHRPECE